MSSGDFDPYYKWLGIPAHEQPPDYYRLLGITRFESDRDVIEHAADGRMAMLRSFQNGPRAAACQALLSKIAIARACLLSSESRLDYDAWLVDEVNRKAAAAQSATPSAPAPLTIEPAPRRGMQRVSAKAGLSHRSMPAAIPTAVKAIAGGVAGIVLGYFVIYLTLGHDAFGFLPPLRKAAEPRTATAVREPKGNNDKPALPPKPATAPRSKGNSKTSPEAPTAVTDKPPAPATLAGSEKSPAPETPDVLSSVGDSIALPKLSAAEPAAIVTFARPLESRLALAVASGAATLPKNAAVAIEELAGGDGWNFVYQMGSEKTALASAKLENLHLTFSWNKDAPPSLRATLANCQITLTYQQQTKVAQLRSPLKAGSLSLDMTKTRQLMLFPVAALPEASKIFLQVRALQEFPAEAAIQKGKAAIPLGDDLVIEFARQPGAQIVLKFFKQLSDGQLALSMEPSFREGRAEYDLTITQLEKSAAAFANTLAEKKNDLMAVQNSLALLRTQVNSLKQKAPPVTDLQDRAVWEQQFVQASGALATVERRAEALKRQVDDFQARVDSVPVLRSFISSLHQAAKIDYRIVAKASEYDIVLVDGTEGVNQSAKPLQNEPVHDSTPVPEPLKGRAERAKQAGLDLDLKPNND